MTTPPTKRVKAALGCWPAGCGVGIFLLIVGGIFVALYSWYYSTTSELWRAAAQGDLETVRRLVESGEAVNQCNGLHGCSPLHAAAGHGHVSVVEYLLQHGALLATRDDQGLTPLHDCACYNGKGGSPAGTDSARAEIARLMLARGADPWAKDDFARHPLDLADASPEVAAVLREAMGRPTVTTTRAATANSGAIGR